MSYIYELLQAPVPPSEWTTEYDFSESPSAFPIAETVNTVGDRETVIARFGAWLEENRLGLLDGEMFIIDTAAADRHFEGRFAAFQQAVTALQKLNETQFIHDHDWVAALIDNLGQAFTQKYGDYMDKIYPVVKDSNVVMLASPLYYWNLSDQIRTTIDRLFALEEGDGNLLWGHDRASALLMAAENHGFEDVRLYYDHLMEYLRWKNLEKVLCGGVMDIGDAKGKKELDDAFELGKSIY